MSWAAITGWGMSVPSRVVTNDDLAASVPGIDAEWIVQRSGIRQRRYAGSGESTSTLATAAARAAMARAGVTAAEIDLIVVATATPDMPIPATAPIVQAALGASKAAAFDVNAACAGFLTALSMVDSSIRTGAIRRAVVIGAEVLSRFVNWSDPKTCVLFGDGAGAVVVEGCDTPAGLTSLTLGAAGESASLIHVPAGGSARPASPQTISAGEHVIRMNGPEVYRAAVRIMSAAAREAMTRARLDATEVDVLILHQANSRIIDEVGARLGIPAERVFCNVSRYGNTSAASIPIAICEAVEAGLLFPGARFVLSAVGAGFAWAAGAGVWTRAPATSVAGAPVATAFQTGRDATAREMMEVLT